MTYKILQEITAARNILFKCGDMELQSTTFLTGLDALSYIDDWELRNCIRSFILLIKHSEFREGVKGETHLNIGSLIDLVDRFHAHDATDPRDKIYALWGLCCDSTLMANLRPDYRKSWKVLLEELAKSVFGNDAFVSAHSNKQMILVYVSGHDLGKIDEVSGAGIWENDQELTVTSMGISKFLNNSRDWTLRVRMRAPTDEIKKGDLVLYLPETRRLVITRPQAYFLRIIMVVDGHLVYINHPQDGWSPWQTFLGSMNRYKTEFPLLWTWEKIWEDEEQDMLSLTAIRIPDSPTSSEASNLRELLKARALSDMASVYMQLDDYDQASYVLRSMVNIYGSLYHWEAEITIEGRERLSTAMDRKLKYQRAKDFLVLRKIGLLPTSLVDLYSPVIHYAAEELPPGASSRILVDFVSKVMSKGVSKKVLVEAVQLCQRDIKHRHYLDLLLHMSNDNLTISTAELLQAAHERTGTSNFIRLAKHFEAPIDNLADILERLRSKAGGYNGNSHFDGKFVRKLLSELPGRFIVTPEHINPALKWDAEALSALSELTAGNFIPTSLVFTSALSHNDKGTPSVIRYLAQHAEPGCEISEDAMLELISYDAANMREVYIALLESDNLIVKITERVLKTAILSNKTDIFRYLCYRPDILVTDDLVASAKNIGEIPERDWVLSKLAELKVYSKFIEQEKVNSLSANGDTDYVRLLTLVRYRKTEFRITEEMVIKAVSKAVSKTPRMSDGTFRLRGLVTEADNFVTCLVKHANQKVLKSLTQSRIFVDKSVSYSLMHTIKSLHSRSKDVSRELEAAMLVLQWSRHVSLPEKYHTISSGVLIEKLKDAGLSNHLKQELLVHTIRNSEYGNSDAHLLRWLFESGVVGTHLSQDARTAVFLQAIERLKNAVQFLEVLFQNGWSSEQPINSGGRTPLHLIPNIRRDKVEYVELLMRYKGAASIDTPDARGRTPRQIVEEKIRKSTDDERVIKRDDYDYIVKGDDGWVRIREIFDEASRCV